MSLFILHYNNLKNTLFVFETPKSLIYKNYPLFAVTPYSLVATYQFFYVLCVVCPSTLKQKAV